MKNVLILPVLVLGAVSFGLTSCARFGNDTQQVVTDVGKGGARVVTVTGKAATGVVKGVTEGGVVVVKDGAQVVNKTGEVAVGVVKGVGKGAAKVVHGAEVQ